MQLILSSRWAFLLAWAIIWPAESSGETDVLCVNSIGGGSAAQEQLTTLLRSGPLPTATDTLRALLIFARNPDSEDGLNCGTYSGNWTDKTTVPSWAASLFEDTTSPAAFTPQNEGSLTHYFHRMSGGKHLLLGRVYSTVVLSDIPISAVGSVDGAFKIVNDDVIQKVDAASSFADHDLDANGVVDYVFICYWSPKSDQGAFFLNLDGGVNAGGFSTVLAADKPVDGGSLTIHSSAGATAFPRARSAMQCGAGGTVRVRNQWWAFQVLAHEFYHDIFAAVWPAFPQSTGNHIGSAGWYDIMEDRDCGMILSGISRYKAGWAQGAELTSTSFSGDTTFVVYDAARVAGAKLVLLRTQDSNQYFTLEVRGSGSAYGRTQPEEPTLPDCCRVKGPNPGLLIVHIHENGARGWATTPGAPPIFDPELMGGLFDGSGRPDPASGDDTLSVYEDTPINPQARDLLAPGGGSTNVWGPFTSPSSNLYVSATNDAQSVYSGWTVYNVEWAGPGTDSMRVRVRFNGATAPVQADTLKSNMTWDGLVQLTGDLVVPSGKELTVKEGSVVVVAAVKDRFGQGDDALRTEPIVKGRLTAAGTLAKPVRVTSSRDATFAHFRGPGQPGVPATGLDWCGVTFELAGAAAPPGYGYVGCLEGVSRVSHTTISNAKVGVEITGLCAPGLEKVTFANIDGGVNAKHILLDRTDVVLPLGKWTGLPPLYVAIDKARWDLEAPVYVVATNTVLAGKNHPAGYGDATKVDLFADAPILTQNGIGPVEYVWFRPEVPDSNTGDSWGGIEVHATARGSAFRNADVGHAGDLIFFTYPESCLVQDSRFHHYANYGIRVTGAGTGGLKVTNSQVLRGALLDQSKGIWGVFAEDASSLRVLNTKIYDYDARGRGLGEVEPGWRRGADPERWILLPGDAVDAGLGGPAGEHAGRAR